MNKLRQHEIMPQPSFAIKLKVGDVVVILSHARADSLAV